jgi:hypothetical protein
VIAIDKHNLAHFLKTATPKQAKDLRRALSNYHRQEHQLLALHIAAQRGESGSPFQVSYIRFKPFRF